MSRSVYAFRWMVACIVATILLAILAGCTITPVKVRSSGPSFDGVSQDSGFLGFGPNGGGYISDAAKARYNALVQTFGQRFTVPLEVDSGIDPTSVIINGRRAWLIDPEHLVKFQTMNRWRKEARSGS